MPFNQLRRQDSFPPTIIHLSPVLTSHDNPSPTLAIQDLNSKPLPSVPQGNTEATDIDSNPISFFLTTPTDSHDFGSDEEIDFFLDHDDYPEVFEDDEDLSAGIEGSDEDLRKRDADVREISPSSLQRQREDEATMDEVEFGFAMPLSLKDFTSRSLSPIDITNVDTGRMSRAGYHPETVRLNGLALHPSSPPQSQRDKNRGRGRVRLSPPVDKDGRSLSWSPGIGSGRRKPVSWRTPGRGIWTIDEDEEFIGGGVFSSSAPTAGIDRYMTRPGVGLGIGGLKKEDGRKRVVKKVRWADLEEMEQ